MKKNLSNGALVFAFTWAGFAMAHVGSEFMSYVVTCYISLAGTIAALWSDD